MTLVIALVLLVAFTWFISPRDASGEPRWATLSGPRAERVAVRRPHGR